jgi:membrane-bound lytic murein transglycosylase F
MKNILHYLVIIVVLVFSSCGNQNTIEFGRSSSDLEDILDRGVIRVATLSRSTSFFVLKNQNMGYEYELAERFARALNVELEIITALDMNDLVEKLDRNEVDLIAYPLTITNEFKGKVRYTDHEYITHQVLIQRQNPQDVLLTDVTQLIGKEVYVVDGSKYHFRLLNLNDEVGGGIIIRAVSNNEDEEKLIEKVANGEISFTVADDNIANVNKTYFDNINTSLPISFAQRSAWAVSPESVALSDTVNTWFHEYKNNYMYEYLYYKYFEQKKSSTRLTATYINEKKISGYDHLFKYYSHTIGWDWRLIASMAYQESRFNPNAVSWAGARGLMQLMPRTAVSLGTTNTSDPNQSVRGAVRYLKQMERAFGYIENKNEREKFILASYNAGLGHIQDAIALTKKHGKDPNKWDDNVADFVLLKSNPEYFNDPVVKYGYLRGEEVYKYVREILLRYQQYKDIIKT